MKCGDISRQLSDYLDGELNKETQNKVNLHLKRCSTCSNELKMLEKSMLILKRLKGLQPPHDFLDFSSSDQEPKDDQE